MRAYNYASSVDVLRHLSNAATFTATSKPNATQVHGFLGDASNELDSALADARYTIPVATTASVSGDLLRSWAAVGAAMFTADAHPAGGDSKHLAFLERRWDAILSGIRGGELGLSDAAQNTDTAIPRFGVPDPLGDGATPYFRRDYARTI